MAHGTAGAEARSDSTTPNDEQRVAMLRAQLLEARAAARAAGAALASLTVSYPNDYAMIAQRADEVALACGRVAGFARLLARET